MLVVVFLSCTCFVCAELGYRLTLVHSGAQEHGILDVWRGSKLKTRQYSLLPEVHEVNTTTEKSTHNVKRSQLSLALVPV